MHSDDIEPLEPGHWIRSFRQLAMRRLDDEADLERALRHAFHLVQLAPRPLRQIIHCTSSEAEFEALLETGAFDAAALRLLGNRTRYSLSRFSDEPGVAAEVWYADHFDRHHATEQSAALALFRAWLKCHQAIDGSGQLDRSSRVVKLTPGETSTEH